MSKQTLSVQAEVAQLFKDAKTLTITDNGMGMGMGVDYVNKDRIAELLRCRRLTPDPCIFRSLM